MTRPPQEHIWAYEKWMRLTPAEQQACVEWERQKIESQSEVSAEMERRDKARRTLQAAVKSGAIARPDTCERCGAKPQARREIQAHHADYSKPLEVSWLCRDCHQKHHKTLRTGWGPE